MNNEIKGVNSCKIALYRKFIQVGERTWQRVLKALDKSGNRRLAEEVEAELQKEFAQQ